MVVPSCWHLRSVVINIFPYKGAIFNYNAKDILDSSYVMFMVAFQHEGRTLEIYIEVSY